MKKLAIVGVVCFVILFLCLLTEKKTRFHYRSNVFSASSQHVTYRWKDSNVPWDAGLADPVNIGSYSKWLGTKSYDWTIEVPSYQVNRNSLISPDAIMFVKSVEGKTYECENGFWTVTCKGDFLYSVDPDKMSVSFNNRYIKMPSEWASDIRPATLTVYKWF